jgi:hypothetical protein
VEEPKPTSTFEIVDPSNALDASRIKHIESVLEKAGALHQEIDAEQGKTAIKIVWQGCHLFVVDDALAGIQDEKLRSEIYGKLLEKYGIRLKEQSTTRCSKCDQRSLPKHRTPNKRRPNMCAVADAGIRSAGATILAALESSRSRSSASGEICFVM